MKLCGWKIYYVFLNNKAPIAIGNNKIKFLLFLMNLTLLMVSKEKITYFFINQKRYP